MPHLVIAAPALVAVLVGRVGAWMHAKDRDYTPVPAVNKKLFKVMASRHVGKTQHASEHATACNL